MACLDQDAVLGVGGHLTGHVHVDQLRIGRGEVLGAGVEVVAGVLQPVLIGAEWEFWVETALMAWSSTVIAACWPCSGWSR